MKNIKFYLLIIIGFLSTLNSQSQIQVLTGIENGSYFQQALDMNKLLPQQNKLNGTDSIMLDFLDIRSSAGSNINFDLLVDEQHPAKAAMMQIDVLLLKRTEDLIHETHLTEDLLILMPLCMEEIHLVSKEGNDITGIESLEGKTVGIGTRSEGSYSTALRIQNSSKIPWINKNLSSQEALKYLLLDRIDAFFILGSAPLKLLNINPLASPMTLQLTSLENVNHWADSYQAAVISKEKYLWLKTDIQTFSLSSVVVINKSKLSDQDLEDLKVWRSITIENLEKLKTEGHQSWETVIEEWDSDIWPLLE